ncbi:MAG: cell wall protein, partial [Deltaproteobacteria bacterium]|nr:cell wall protein [Deltaproteobacteria bacterium]
MSWDASSDATGVAACRLYRDSSLLVELNALSHVDINLAALNEYSYSIAAVDLAGN